MKVTHCDICLTLNFCASGTFSKVYLASFNEDSTEMIALKHLVPTSSPGRIENELNCLQTLG